MFIKQSRIIFNILLLPLLLLLTVLDSGAQTNCVSEDESKKIVDAIKSQQNAQFNKKLQLELLEMMIKTTQIYEDLSKLTTVSKTFEDRLKRQRESNTARLCQIFKEYGWTSKALVGEDAAEVASIIFMDTPSLEFQKQLTPIIQAAFEAGEISKSNYAKIVDQLRVRAGRKQVFGTLVGISRDLLVLYPIENEAELTKLRSEYELPPLADQIRKLELKYKAVVVKTPSSTAPAAQSEQREEIKPPQKASEGERDDVLRIDTNLVNLNVTVMPEKTGTTLPPLDKDDFAVLENGSEQAIDLFAATQVPFDITLLVDISGSTSNKIKLIRKTTRNFIKAARPVDRISIAVFDEDITVISPLTQDREKLFDSVDKIKSRGGSKVWDALAFAIDKSNEIQNSNQQNRERRSAIVFMTDGEDNTFVESTEPSKITFADLLEKVRQSSSLIVPIHLDTRSSYGLSEKLYTGTKRALNLLADESGGLSYEAGEVDDLEGIYPQVINGLSRVYSIGYSPSDTKRDGAWRSVKVDIKKHPNLRIRTRKGYYAY